MNRLRLLTGVSATLASSLALVLTATPAHAQQTASQACYGVSAPVELTTVVTVPRVAGFRFSFNGAAYQTGSDGAVQLVRPPCIATYRLHVLTPTMPLGQGRQARFARWSGEFNGGSLLYARFDTYRLVRLSFQEETGRPIDRRLLGVVTLKSDVGQIVHLPTDVDRCWLQSSRVVAGLNIRPTYWTVQSLPADGSNVVTAPKIKFFPGRTGSVHITLLYFRLTVRVKDRLFGWPVGSSVELRFPSGHRALYHLGRSGALSLPSVPRGIYALRVNGPVVKVWRPVALSRDQAVALDTLSYLDVAVLAGVGLLIIIGPLLAGRLLRKPRPSRRRRTPHQVAAAEAEEISSVSAVLQEVALQEVALGEAIPQDAVLRDDMLQEDMLQGDALPDDAVQDVALPDVALPDVALPDVALPDEALPDDAVRTDVVQADSLPEKALPDVALQEEARQDFAMPEEARQDFAMPEEALRDVATLHDDTLLNGAVGTDAVHEVPQDDAYREDTVGTNAVRDDPVIGDTVRYDMVTDGAVQDYTDDTIADHALQENTVMRDAVTDHALQRGGPQPDAAQMPLWDEPQEDALQKARREDALQNAQQEDALQMALRDDALRQDPLQLALRDDALREDPLQLTLPEDPVKLALQEDALQMALRDDAPQDDMLHEDTPQEDTLQGDARDEDTLQVQPQEDGLQEDVLHEDGLQEGGLQVALQVAALQAAALAEDASS